LTQYLPTATFVLLDLELIGSRAKALADTNEEFLHAAWDTAIAGGSAPIDLSTGGFLELTVLLDSIRDTNRLVEINSLPQDHFIDLGLREIPTFQAGGAVTDWIIDQLAQSQKLVITAKGHGTAERIVEVLSALSVPVSLSEIVREPASGSVMVVVADLPHGFFVADQNLMVLTETEFFGVASSYQSPNSRKLAKRRGPQVDPLTLKQGDYVVHEIHGIGRFKELVQRDKSLSGQGIPSYRIRVSKTWLSARYSVRADGPVGFSISICWRRSPGVIEDGWHRLGKGQG